MVELINRLVQNMTASATPQPQPIPKHEARVDARHEPRPDGRNDRGQSDNDKSRSGKKIETAEKNTDKKDNDTRANLITSTPVVTASLPKSSGAAANPSSQSAQAPGQAKAKKPAAVPPGISKQTTAFPEAQEVLAVNMTKDAVKRARALGFTPVEALRLDQLGYSITSLQPPSGMSVDDSMQVLKREGLAERPEPNFKYQIYRSATGSAKSAPAQTAVPMQTPCGTDRCYGTAMVGWSPSLQGCAKGVSIGVIDTGFDSSHPAFKGRTFETPSRSLKSSTSVSEAANWHGTGVLALLAGDPASETPGMVPSATLYVADIFYGDATGQPISDTMSLVTALDWLAEKKVNIVNLSLAGPEDQLLRKAVTRLTEKGTIFVAAVGNEGPMAPPVYPAGYPSVIAVTAVNQNLTGYRHAGRGPHVDFAAPGVKIWTAAPGETGEYHSGTSFAVPFATAIVAAVHNQLPKQHTKADVLQRLSFQDLGAAGIDPIYGRGLVMAPQSCGPTKAPTQQPPLLTTSFTPTRQAQKQ